MSCPGELTHWLYVEGELAAQELRTFEAHLVSCQACRAGVVALRDESELLSDVLMERTRTLRAPVAQPRAPETGVVIGLPAAIALVTAAFAAVGFLFESSLPGGLDLFNPLRLKGAYEMAFDLVFLLRDRAPGLVELALSLGGLAAVSALLTFGAGALHRRVFGATALALFALVGAPPPAGALELRIDKETRIGAAEVLEESLLVTGDRVQIDGVVVGDLIAAAERVIIRGKVDGNLYVFARDLEIEGIVEGSVHGVVERARIDGEVTGSVYAVGENLDLGPSGRIGRDMSALAELVVLGGELGRDLIFAGEELEVNSRVGRNVEIRAAERVVLSDGARVGGEVEARLDDESDIERAAGAQIAGELRILPREQLGDYYMAAYRDPWVYLAHGLALVAAFLFGLLLFAASPKLFATELHTAPQFFRALGFGFLVAVATPVAILALALTVIGIPVAVLGLFVFIVTFYAAEIIVGAWIGSSLLPPENRGFYAFGRSLLLGLLILTVASHIPFVGPPISVVAALLGLGLILERVRRSFPIPA
jgi:cytoskeletal protein CcmA (bactofilin family)